jgi:hypothetical protein
MKVLKAIKRKRWQTDWWDSQSPIAIGGEFSGPANDVMRSFVISLKETLGDDLFYAALRVKYSYSRDIAEYWFWMFPVSF